MMFTKLRWRFYMWRHPLDLEPHFENWGQAKRWMLGELPTMFVAHEMGPDEWRTRLSHIIDIEGPTRLDMELEQILHERSLEE